MIRPHLVDHPSPYRQRRRDPVDRLAGMDRSLQFALGDVVVVVKGGDSVPAGFRLAVVTRYLVPGRELGLIVGSAVFEAGPLREYQIWYP